MDEQDLNEALYAKMEAEQKAFRAYLLTLPPEKILDHAYEYVIREDIVMEMEELELSEAKAKALQKSRNPLADVYREWSKTETHHMDDVRDVIENCADGLINADRKKAQREER